MPESFPALAVHVGAYHTRFRRLTGAEPAVIEPEAEWEQVVPTPTSPARFAELIRGTLSNYGPGLQRVAVSVPGVVDESTGIGLVSPNLPWLEQFRLADLFKRESGAGVRVIQEVRALALGHAATTDDRDFLLVDFGSGMGSALVLEGRLIQGAIPVSGEIGHLQIPDATRRCGCGSTGCVETLVSRSALLGDLSERTGRPVTQWADFDQHVAEHGVEPWLKTRLDAVGRAIGSALNTVGVPKVIITGSLVQMPSVIVAEIGEATRKHALAARYRTIDITSAPRQRLAGLRALLAQ